MKTKMLITLILFLSMGTLVWADSPSSWIGDGPFTFSDADPFFMEASIGDAWPNATLNIIGGEFGFLLCHGYSTINMSGGNATSGISTYDHSTLNLSRGNLGSIGATDNSQINIFVLDYIPNPNSYLGYDQITGHWENGNEFDILISEVSWPNITINVIPEPSTISLLSVGVFFLKRRLA